MNDQDETDIDAIEHEGEGEAGEQPTTATQAEVYGGMLALIGMIQNPRAFKSKLKEFRQAEEAANKAAADLVTARATHDQHCASEGAAIAARAEAVHKSEVDLFVRKNAVASREDAAREVENSWRYVMESDYVQKGFQSAEFEPLVKAKRWIAGLPMVSTDGDSPADAEIDTSDTDPAFIETMPPGVSLARSSQSPPRSAKARRSMRRAAAEH
jgi:flagellar basal body rod protein FlgB